MPWRFRANSNLACHDHIRDIFILKLMIRDHLSYHCNNKSLTTMQYIDAPHKASLPSLFIQLMHLHMPTKLSES